MSAIKWFLFLTGTRSPAVRESVRGSRSTPGRKGMPCFSRSLVKFALRRWVFDAAALRMCLAWVVLLIATGQFCAGQTPPIFNVMSYGATGNGTNLDSPAINAAIAAAGAAGGGTVTFPPGTYLCGSIHLTNCPSDLTLYLSNNAVIWASATNIDQHESSPYGGYQDDGHTWFHDSLIWGENLNHFTIAGTGKIDGNHNLTTGDPGTNYFGDKDLCLVLCSDVTITGITITNGGHFGILAQACTNLLVTSARIWEDTSRDGFNLIDSSDAIVTNCDIEGSDDAMCLKSDYALGRVIGSHDVLVVNCNILSTENNATQFGSETVGNFSNVTFSNLQITAAGKAGVGITSQDGSVIDGVIYNNITMSNCACPIFLKLDYRTTGSPHPVVGGIENISINNVTAVHSTYYSRTNTSTINGYFNTNTFAEVPIENITFSNVIVSNIGGQPAGAVTNDPVENQDWQPQDFGEWPSYGWYLRWANNIYFTNCETHFNNNDDRPAVIADTVTNVIFNGFSSDVGRNNSNFDMGFFNTTFEVTNAVASTNAPVPGAALRISTVAPTPPPVTSFAFQAIDLNYVTNGAIAAVQNDSNEPGGHWLALEGTGVGQSIQYAIPSLPAGTYDLQMYWKGNNDRGILKFALDGTVLGTNLDQYSSGETYEIQDYGDVTFATNGTHTILLSVAGKNPSSSSYWLSAGEFLFTLVQPPQPVFSGALIFSNGIVQLAGSGYPTLLYRVQVSTNLASTNWMTIGATNANANGALIFTDTNAGPPVRFYRLVTP